MHGMSGIGSPLGAQLFPQLQLPKALQRPQHLGNNTHEYNVLSGLLFLQVARTRNTVQIPTVHSTEYTEQVIAQETNAGPNFKPGFC